MLRNYCATAALCAGLIVSSAAPALAAGEIIITQAKALAGNVTPGDAPGFPVQLRASGSYVLGSNLNVPAGSTAIQIFADDITIDLSGYRLFGSAKTAIFGIIGAAGRDDVTIRNGTITGFKADGIAATGSHWTVENMRVVENGRHGIFVDGFHTAIRSSMSAVNGDRGISCGLLCLVEGSVVSDNRSGIVMGTGIVLGSVIGDNAEFGISGTLVGFGNNLLVGNNGGSADVSPSVTPMEPNLCNECPL